MAEKLVYKQGDTVPAGIYICIQCSQTQNTNPGFVTYDCTSKLPACPICGHTKWIKP